MWLDAGYLHKLYHIFYLWVGKSMATLTGLAIFTLIIVLISHVAPRIHGGLALFVVWAMHGNPNFL